MKSKIKMIIPFIGGPMHGIKFEMQWIPALNWFVDERDRCIYAYVRDEMAYFYEKDLSARMTAVYDSVKSQFPGRWNKITPVE